MPASIIDRGWFPGVRAAILVVSAALFAGCRGNLAPRPNTGGGSEKLRSGITRPRETRGAPYPAVPPSRRIPNEDDRDAPVPTGPRVGDMQPTSPPTSVSAAADSQRRPLVHTVAYRRGQPRPLVFRAYREFASLDASTSECCPEVSVAENGETTLMTGNYWMALSVDGGASFSSVNPTTIFPEVDGGFCCDQIVAYVPEIDMFVWLLQYWVDGSNNNRIRLAAQTTAEVRSSNGTAWTYWDFVSDVFNRDRRLDRNDLAVGERSLWWNTEVVGGGRVVVRIPLDQIAARGTINFQFTGETDAPHSHLTQNATNTVYWAGHEGNSVLRVYSMRDGDDFYSWRTVTVASWPNGTNSSACPSGSDWMTFEAKNHTVFGNALQGRSVWFAWLAAAGGGFPLPHVQMVRINPDSWTREEQVQIWNPTIAFQDAYLSTNSRGELGMEIAFGGRETFPSSAVGVWGDFVVYYPRLSTRCSPTKRWGDYNHSRRRGGNGMEWVAGGYSLETDASGNRTVLPHYIRFSR
ncbi:MAG: hypothetical protein ACJ8GN_16300 [Longimicrobiaceae bacterium]